MKSKIEGKKSYSGSQLIYVDSREVVPEEVEKTQRKVYGLMKKYVLRDGRPVRVDIYYKMRRDRVRYAGS